jgi:putative component of toxin-antitoxin plasmid stabilization module
MKTFHRTAEFDAWLSGLKDKIGKARIIKRIRAAEAGNFGDEEDRNRALRCRRLPR